MEAIILLFLVMAVINAINNAARRKAGTAARGRPPRAYPVKPHFPVEDWEEEEIRPLPEEVPPAAVRAVRLQPPAEAPPEGRRRTGKAERTEGSRQAPSAAPAEKLAGRFGELIRTRDGLVAAIVFHELLQPPLSRRRLKWGRFSN